MRGRRENVELCLCLTVEGEEKGNKNQMKEDKLTTIMIRYASRENQEGEERVSQVNR